MPECALPQRRKLAELCALVPKTEVVARGFDTKKALVEELLNAVFQPPDKQPQPN